MEKSLSLLFIEYFKDLNSLKAFHNPNKNFSVSFLKFIKIMKPIRILSITLFMELMVFLINNIVMHSCYVLGNLQKNKNVFTPMQRFALVFSGLCHDVGHTGFTNAF